MCRRQKCFDFIQRHYSVILILTDFFFVYVVIGFFKGFYGVIYWFRYYSTKEKSNTIKLLSLLEQL